jgi:hypothetical protein
MLIEIRCDAFHSHEKTRQPIIFNAGLNTVLGDNVGSNSIGKSTFLMIVDSAFGGDDYVNISLDVQKNIGAHIIQFAFLLKNQKYYFSRSTVTHNRVNKCDMKYHVLSDMSIVDFRKLLLDAYGISLPSMSFRDIVSRYFRIYKRENLNENLPLQLFQKEREEDSILALEKLFNLYANIIELRNILEEEKEKHNTFKNSIKYKFVSAINSESQLKENKREISRLKTELEQIDDKKNVEQREFWDDLEPDTAKQISVIKKDLTTLRRDKNRLVTKIAQIQSNLENNNDMTKNDFSVLQSFFPSINLRAIQEIDEFHVKLSDILRTEFIEEQQKTEALLTQVNLGIDEYKAILDDIGVPDGLSRKTLDNYYNIRSEIEHLEMQNNSYLKQKELKTTVATVERQLVERQSGQLRELQSLINSKMSELNNALYDSQKKAPILTFDSRRNYTFETPDDTGTGTSYKGLVVFDLSILALTPLLALVHDSVILKQIADAPLEKILELYQKSGKQIFIALDKGGSYTKHAEEILEQTAILRLSDNGNELFGRSWNIKEPS